jgi:hypothetical protein
MAGYKRNQVEDAILRTVSAKSVRRGDSKSRLQRLLVTDRRLASRKRSDAKAHSRFAFFSREAPGSGSEVMFSEFEAFALLVGLAMLDHGIPQATVVGILRQLRSDLQAAHREMLKKDPQLLFDPQAVRSMARPGMFPADNTDPVYLASVKLPGSTAVRVHAAIKLCRGQEDLSAFIATHAIPGYGATFFELVTLMHQLSANLAKTRPIKRGRSTV